ncbi:hypothetical protein Ga0466249_004745 [Sporomusaceae bacterium BoRhaA]|uniref:hypothetical protein n=1 Tax=Pelorhabdus rhamnosifermentans TaxID=2772457 RepID=UPI001C063602|nr:hypothetical protein [Pelorhabdus rhamnosifermentans]MBU2703600.1 hypothetical protein [Pelorhabdus rhamnosifermentans]
MAEQKNTVAAEDRDGEVNLSQLKTLDLLNELSNRQGIEKAYIGLFQPYELKRKFNDDRSRVEADYILIVRQEGLSE